MPPRNYVHPSVSPDGTRLAVEVDNGGDSDIYLYDLSGQSEMRQFTYGGNSRDPSWKDDRTLTFASDRDGPMSIWEQRIDGGAAMRLTTPEEGFEHVDPVWAPDGRLVFGRSQGPNETLDLYVVSLPDGEPEPLVVGEGAQTGVTFSPDGSAMAYMSQGGPSGVEVFVSPYPPDGSMTRVSAEDEPGMWPIFYRNGAGLRLAYQDPRAGNFVAVDVTTPGFAPSNRRILGGLTANRGSPNMDSVFGTNKLVITWSPEESNAAQSASARIVVIENWADTLEGRVPPLGDED